MYNRFLKTNLFPILAYKDNDYWYWFENADFNNRGIHKFDSFDELLTYQYNRYVEFLKTLNIKNDEIKNIIVTEFDKPKEHASVEEYLNHVINSKIIIFTEKLKGVDPNE